MIQDKLLPILCHLPLYEHNPLESGVKVHTQLLLGLGTPLPDGEDVLVIPHHDQQLLPVTGTQVWQDAIISQPTGPGLVLEERCSEVLLLCYLLLSIQQQLL